MSRGLSIEDPRFEKAVSVACSMFARNSTVRPADLDDLAQEVRMALIQEGGASPMACAKCTALDWWRDLWGRKKADGTYPHSKTKASRRMELLERYDPEVGGPVSGRSRVNEQRVTPLARAEDPGPLPDAIVLSREVASVLERLDPRDRALLQMRYLLDMRMCEIAQELGVSESRVSQLMPKAEQAFRVALKRAA